MCLDTHHNNHNNAAIVITFVLLQVSVAQASPRHRQPRCQRSTRAPHDEPLFHVDACLREVQQRVEHVPPGICGSPECHDAVGVLAPRTESVLAVRCSYVWTWRWFLVLFVHVFVFLFAFLRAFLAFFCFPHACPCCFSCL